MILLAAALLGAIILFATDSITQAIEKLIVEVRKTRNVLR